MVQCHVTHWQAILWLLVLIGLNPFFDELFDTDTDTVSIHAILSLWPLIDPNLCLR